MIGSFLKELTFLSQNRLLVQIFETPLQVQRVKGTFSDSSGHNILEIFNNLVQVQIVQSKIKIDL